MVKSKKLKIKKEKEISYECTEIPLNLLKVLMDPPKSEQKISRKQRKTIKICKKLIDLETERIE